MRSSAIVPDLLMSQKLKISLMRRLIRLTYPPREDIFPEADEDNDKAKKVGDDEPSPLRDQQP